MATNESVEKKVDSKKVDTKDLAKKDPAAARELALAALKEYGNVTGWLRSRTAFSAIDSKGKPIPWYTYSATEFLSRRVKPELDVFEFGTGNSTLWWAARTRSVTSVEHDRKWAKTTRKRIPANVTYNWIPRKKANDAYSRAAQATARRFDVIVVDGKDRYNCTINSLDALTPAGVIVWDNADVPKYQALFDELGTKGFKRLPFVGHGPITPRFWETSIFYRADNCLGI